MNPLNIFNARHNSFQGSCPFILYILLILTLVLLPRLSFCAEEELPEELRNIAAYFEGRGAQVTTDFSGFGPEDFLELRGGQEIDLTALRESLQSGVGRPTDSVDPGRTPLARWAALRAGCRWRTPRR